MIHMLSHITYGVILGVEAIQKIIGKSNEQGKSLHHPHQDLNGIKMKMNRLQYPIKNDKLIKIPEKQKRKKLIFYYLVVIPTNLVLQQ